MKPKITCSFIQPPAPELLQKWKLFLLIGTRLRSRLNYAGNIELFAEEEAETLFKEAGIETGNAPPPDPEKQAFKDRAERRREKILKEFDCSVTQQPLPATDDAYLAALDIIPFLDGIPRSGKAAIAILAAMFANYSKQGHINDVAKLFRMINVPIEHYQIEGMALLKYASSKESYLHVLPNPESGQNVVFMSIKGFKNILGLDISEIQFEDIPGGGAINYIAAMVNISKIRKKLKNMRTHNLRSVVPKTTLQDVVLDDTSMLKIKSVVEYAKLEKKKPFKLLFHGTPGTGKTHTAMAIAGELKKKLVCVDISKLLGMYIGETEKNLSAHFDFAEKERAILFLDEADSLLKERMLSSKRWEISDVNCLLMLLESRSASVILCTNLYDSLDDALLRRVDEIVEFKVPDKEARISLWQKELLKNNIHLEAIDINAIAEIKITGGLIMNAAKKAQRIMVVNKNAVMDTQLFLNLAEDEKKKIGKSVAEPKVCGFGR